MTRTTIGKVVYRNTLITISFSTIVQFKYFYSSKRIGTLYKYIITLWSATTNLHLYRCSYTPRGGLAVLLHIATDVLLLYIMNNIEYRQHIIEIIYNILLNHAKSDNQCSDCYDDIFLYISWRTDYLSDNIISKKIKVFNAKQLRI